MCTILKSVFVILALCPIALGVACAEDGAAISLCNQLMWPRGGPVVVKSPFFGESAIVKVTDQSGRSYPARHLGDMLYFTAHDVAPADCKVFRVSKTSDQMPTDIKAQDTTIENKFFRVTVSFENGVITEIYDKINSRAIIQPGSYGALLQMFEYGQGQNVKLEDLLGESEVILQDKGPARGVISFDHIYGESQVMVEVMLYQEVPRIDFHITADWQEQGRVDRPSPVLKIAFPTTVQGKLTVFDAPSGYVESTADDVCFFGGKWMDVSDGDYGIAMTANKILPFEVEDGTLRATLLGASLGSNLGISEMTLSLYPHKGGWREAAVDKRASELSEPLSAKIVME